MSDIASYKPEGITRRYAFGALVAIEMLLSFSFLGYFHVEPISVTTAYIPVLLAGALTGPFEAVTVGAVFGLSSMWKASANYVMPADKLFSPFFSPDPIGSLILSLGTRMLFGLAVGFLYLWARRSRHPLLGIGVVSYFGRTVHSFFVYSSMALFFPKSGYSPLIAFSSLFAPSDILINIVTAGVIIFIFKIVVSKPFLQFKRCLELSESLRSGERRYSLSLFAVVVVTLISAMAVTFYFVNRLIEVLNTNDIFLTGTGYADVLHLQIQFMLGVVSVCILVILFFILNRRYASYMAHEGKIDSVTGVMTRKAFFSQCSKALRSAEEEAQPAEKYFIMLDLDRFKEINDSLGHPAGDKALKETALCLKDVFGPHSLIGRIGGDEFAVLICSSAGRDELETSLRHFMNQMRRTSFGDMTLSCSVGVLPVRENKSPEKLYAEADKLLYSAKEQGRDRYVIGDL